MDLLLEFEQRLDTILVEAFDGEWTAAVGIVQCGDKFLLGLARNSGDDREGKWVCPGGRIKRGESAEKAAVREVREETGIRCRAVGKAFRLHDRKGVAFVHCKASRGQDFDNNHEFSALGFFTRKDMKALKLYNNVLKLIDRVT